MNATSIDRATRSTGFSKSHHVNTNSDNISENQRLTRNTETLQTESIKYVVGRIIRHLIQEAMTEYVLNWYGYDPEVDTIARPQHLPNHSVVSYWQRQRNWRRRGSTRQRLSNTHS